MFRAPLPADSTRLIALAAASGIFKPGEAEELLGGILSGYHARALGLLPRIDPKPKSAYCFCRCCGGARDCPHTVSISSRHGNTFLLPVRSHV